MVDGVRLILVLVVYSILKLALFRATTHILYVPPSAN